MSYTVCMTRSRSRCYDRKKDCTYLRVEVDNNSLCQQQCWCNLLLLRNSLILTDLIIVIIVIQDDNDNIIVAYEAVSSVITSLTVAVTSLKMLWHMMTFWKSIILHFWQSVQLSETNTSLFWIKLHLCMMVSETESVVSKSVSYKTSQQEKQEWQWSKRVNKGVQLLCINWKNRICIICCSDEH
jgi:hypothetical protein